MDMQYYPMICEVQTKFANFYIGRKSAPTDIFNANGCKGLTVDSGDDKRGRDEPKVRNRKGLPDLNGLFQLGLAGGLSADGLGVVGLLEGASEL